MSSSHDDHDHGELPPPTLEEVSDGVFAYIQLDGSWWLNNCGAVLGPEGWLAVDTCATERRTRQFLDTVGGVTDQPVRMLLNTHHHGDHTHGNYLTGLAARMGHTRCRELILASGINHYEAIWPGVQWGDLQLAPPFITFDDHLSVWMGDLEVEFHYIGNAAHTTNDVVAWIPSRRILFAGDLVFNGGTPFMMMGSVTGSLRALDRVAQFPAEVVVPGHGKVCDLGVINNLRAYDQFILDTARKGRDAGLTPLQVARETDLGDFAGLLDPERIVGNLHRAYAEMDGVPEGAPIDLVAAIGDMITYNDGKPLRCLA